MEILRWLSLESVSVSSYTGVEDLLFILYTLVSILIKKSRYLLAFSFSMLLVCSSLFDSLKEYQIYLAYFIIYSYVCSCSHRTKTMIACVIMCVLDLNLSYDAYRYGIGGTHGTFETILYKNIEYLAFGAHIIIIISLVRVGRVLDGVCGVFSYAFNLSSSGSYLFAFCYNIFKIQPANK